HVLEVFSRVFRICPNIEFYLFLEQVEMLRELSSDFLLPNVNLVRMEHANPIKRLCVQLPAFQKKYNLDLLHTQYISPIPSFCKTVITLHDILFESHPQYFSPLFNLRSKLLMRTSAARVAHIFTVSEYSKKEISSRYKINSDDITVLHNGVDRGRFYPGIDGLQFVVDKGLRPKGYILTVGRLEPRKNHVSLINAYAQLDTELPLVIIGQRHFGYQQIEVRIRELGLSGRVILLENIPDADLPSFYRHAKIFVYPTWAEGFGMPIIEAMASGVPVITSNTTSLPEVAGDACVLIEPADIPGLRDAMGSLISRDDFVRELGLKGLARSAVFSWDKSAQALKNDYQKTFNE
ncbi:MAG: glycosyltransferase family 4 protein, partial [Nitrososphaerales archaeon]